MPATHPFAPDRPREWARLVFTLAAASPIVWQIHFELLSGQSLELFRAQRAASRNMK
jgi:hypothetical protein